MPIYARQQKVFLVCVLRILDFKIKMKMIFSKYEVESLNHSPNCLLIVDSIASFLRKFIAAQETFKVKLKGTGMTGMYTQDMITQEFS